MAKILIILPAGDCRRWHVELAERLTETGHAVSIESARGAWPVTFGLGAVLAMERRRFGSSLASRCDAPVAGQPQAPDLVIDLAGSRVRRDVPVLTIAFSGSPSFEAGLGSLVAAGRAPELAASIDGGVVARGRPMIRDRLWLSRAANDLLAAAIALLAQAVARHLTGQASAVAASQPASVSGRSFIWSYPLFLVRALAGRAVRKIQRGRRPFYWQVAYRLLDGPGVAETGQLDGPSFTVLPDDGSQFYADPFVFEHNSRTFLFVEAFPFATGRGVVSVAELGADGTFGTPRVVLEEPHHLSYPQVFAHDGAIYMLPESAAARELVLYRATRFPDAWVRDTVLIAGRDINDATLLERDGRFWLFATEGSRFGSPSDTMVAFSANGLHGPWRAHTLNPLAVDHSAARPGGAFIHDRGGIFLPVQNGSESYGGGLGLMRLEQLDDGDVRFGPAKPILPGPAWNRRGIHTLNRAGRVEVVDSAG